MMLVAVVVGKDRGITKWRWGYASRFSRKGGGGAGKGRDKVCKCIGYHDPLLEEEYRELHSRQKT